MYVENEMMHPNSFSLFVQLWTNNIRQVHLYSRCCSNAEKVKFGKKLIRYFDRSLKPGQGERKMSHGRGIEDLGEIRKSEPSHHF